LDEWGDVIECLCEVGGDLFGESDGSNQVGASGGDIFGSVRAHVLDRVYGEVGDVVV
jgi:hypothetical protein